jgi:hypothetical protein
MNFRRNTKRVSSEVKAKDKMFRQGVAEDYAGFRP